MRCPSVYRADETGRRIKSLSSSGEVEVVCLIPLFFFVSPGRETTAPCGRATTTGG